MVILSVVGCLLLISILMALTVVFRVIQALFETLVNVTGLLGVYALLGIGMWLMGGFASMTANGFWGTIFTFVIIFFIIGIVATVYERIMAAESVVACFLKAFYDIMSTILKSIADLFENGLKYFVGLLSKRITLT